MNEHLVGFGSMPDLEESPMRPLEIMDENARLDARFDPAVRAEEYMRIVERENEERSKKIGTKNSGKKRVILKTHWRGSRGY